MAARNACAVGSGYLRSESPSSQSSRRIASTTRGDGGYGFSFVLSFTGRASAGCSPGTYGVSLLTMSLQNRLKIRSFIVLVGRGAASSRLRVAMQVHHRAFHLVVDREWHYSKRAFDRCIDYVLLLAPRWFQHKIRHIRFRAGTRGFGNEITRMADADPQPPILLHRQMRGNVLQSIVPAAAAAKLQLHRAGRQIEFIVCHQDFVGQNLEELRNGYYGLPRSVHEGLRLEQMDLLAIEPAAAVVPVKPALIT